MTDPVRVQILVVPDCPHAASATALVTRLLADLNTEDTKVRTTVVTDAQQAAELGFAGSPTVLVNGIDPFAGPIDQVGLGCRLHRTPAGLSDPDPDQLARALSAASHGHDGAETPVNPRSGTTQAGGGRARVLPRRPTGGPCRRRPLLGRCRPRHPMVAGDDAIS